jgi:hypothetical protein
VHFCPVCVFVAIEQFSCHDAAELFNLVDIAVNRLLQYFVDYLKIPGKVCSLEAAGQVNVYIEIGNENDRPFLMAMYFDKFFYIFNPDTGEVYPDIRRRCLYIRQFPVKRFVRGLIVIIVLNRSSHPDGVSRVLL